MIFIDLCTSEMHSRPTRAIATLRSRWRGASAALPSSCAATCSRKEGERKGTKLQQEALRSDTKPDLLSSAPPPVMAEALQPNEQTVTSGRQVIARQASRPRTQGGSVAGTLPPLNLLKFQLAPLLGPTRVPPSTLRTPSRPGRAASRPPYLPEREGQVRGGGRPPGPAERPTRPLLAPTRSRPCGE